MKTKPTYYWDTCMFYEWLNDEPATPFRKRAMRRLVEENENGENVVATSVATHIELLPDKISPEKEALYAEKFDGERMVQHEINPNVVRLAREIRNHYYRDADHPDGPKMMDLGDSIHLASAIILDVDEFHTRDNCRKGSKIPLVSLYKWSGEDSVCGKYPLDIVSPEDDQAELNDQLEEE